MVAWTTTPWTLPSNLALCVNPDKDYVKVREKDSGDVYVLMEARICELYKDADTYEVLEKFKGKTLEGKSYEPLFDYFATMKGRGAFKVLVDGYVTEDSGTGVVHQAPGELRGIDKVKRCMRNKGLIAVVRTGRLTNCENVVMKRS